jgi:hypothetical protein
MEILSMVLWIMIRFANFYSLNWGSLSRPMRTLQWQTYALYALLSMVSSQSAKTLADPAFPRNLRSV